MDREALENIVLNGIAGVDGICDMIKDCIDSYPILIILRILYSYAMQAIGLKSVTSLNFPMLLLLLNIMILMNPFSSNLSLNGHQILSLYFI